MTERITVDQAKLRRIYEPAGPDDRAPVVIGRLWRRGSWETDTEIDRRVKDIAPSTTLQKWPGHDPEFLKEFRCRYAAEVCRPPELLDRLRTLARRCVFSAYGQFHSAAVALRNFLLRRKLQGKAKADHR